MSIDRSAARAACGLALVLLLTCDVSGAAAAGYNWNNGAGGSAAVSGNWSPIGVPGAHDDATIGLGGSYTITWLTPADTLQSLTLVNTSPTFSINSRLGIAFHPLLENNTFLTITHGRIDGPSWSMIENNSSASLTLTGTTTQAWAMTPSVTSVFGAHGGSAGLTINGGAAFRSVGEISLGPSAGTTLTAAVSGNPGGQASLLATTTTGVPGRGWIAVGDYGQATLGIGVGGKLNPAGDLFVGRHPGASGLLQLPSDVGSAPVIDARGQLYIGANDEAGIPGGTGVVDIQLGGVSVLGHCWLGDPDETPGGPVKAKLTIEGAANAVFAGGITMNDALSGELVLLRGITQLIGGTTTIKQAAPFLISGPGPELWLENGSVTDIWPNSVGKPTLGLGSNAGGKLRVAGSGTQLHVHGGAAMGDSLYGYSEMDVDSAATVEIQGDLSAGAGYYYSNIFVRGLGSTLTVQDTTTLGGGIGGSVSLLADSSATLNFNDVNLAGSPTTYAILFVEHGTHGSAHGVTVGPGMGFLQTGFSGARFDVTDHLDLTGQALAEVDTESVLAYDGGTRPFTVGANGPRLIVFSGGLVQATPGIDVRGELILSDYAFDLVAENAAIRRVPGAQPRSVAVTGSAPAVVQSSLTRVLGSGYVHGLGILKGRILIDSPIGLLGAAAVYGDATGRLMAGDSTKSDGFISIGQTTIGNGDTLLVLDSNGGDLGKVRIDGGVLQLPKPGQLKSGFVLQGSGTVDGSLVVRDSAWVSFAGQVTGDIALAGTLDLGPTTAALLIGSLHPTATGRVALKLGHVSQDLVLATGTTALAGTLDLRSIAGDLPAIGDTFTVVVAGGVSGTFANVTVNGQPGASVAHVLYRPTDVRVAFVGAVTGVDDPPSASVVAPASLRFAALGGPRDGALALDLPTSSSVRVTLYDVTGRQIEVLAEGELGPGRHRLALGRAALGSGMYFARAEVRSESGTRVLTTRAVVLR